MSSEYSSYLLAIVLIIAAVAGGLIFLVKAGGKSRRESLPKPVEGGNVSVFFDRTGNATVIPYVKDKYGSGKATADVVFIQMPYDVKKLGFVIRTSMNGCLGDAPCSNAELLSKLEAYDWAAFSVDKRNISIYYNKSYGIIFNTTRRKIDGAYEFNHNGVERSLPPDTDDETLGSTVLLLLQKCR